MTRKGHLKVQERELIYLYLNQGFNNREIGRKIGRDHTIIGREINRNKGPDNTYKPSQAQKLATQRKSRVNRNNSLKHPRILKYVKGKFATRLVS